jgi:hypothetical protein
MEPWGYEDASTWHHEFIDGWYAVPRTGKGNTSKYNAEPVRNQRQTLQAMWRRITRAERKY